MQVEEPISAESQRLNLLDRRVDLVGLDEDIKEFNVNEGRFSLQPLHNLVCEVDPAQYADSEGVENIWEGCEESRMFAVVRVTRKFDSNHR